MLQVSSSHSLTKGTSENVTQCATYQQVKISITDNFQHMLSKKSFSILCFILNKTLKYKKTSDVIPKCQFQDQFGLSRSSVKRALKELANYNLISIQHRHHPNGDFDVSSYSINVDYIMSKCQGKKSYIPKNWLQEPKCQSLEFGNPVPNFISAKTTGGGFKTEPDHRTSSGCKVTLYNRTKDRQVPLKNDRTSVTFQKKEHKIQDPPSKYKLPDGKIGAYQWLKSMQIDSKDDTLNYWARVYDLSTLQWAYGKMEKQVNRGIQIKCTGAYMQKTLKSAGTKVNDHTIRMKMLAEKMKQYHKWHTLQITDTHCYDINHSAVDMAFSLPQETFLMLAEKTFNTIKRMNEYAHDL